MAFRSHAPVPDTSSPPDATSTAASQPPTSLLQPHGHQTELTSTPAVIQPLFPPRPELVSQEATYQEGTPPPLQDDSGAVRAQVAQHLQGALSLFLLTNEDSPTDEEASPTKRKRRTIKSGMLRTQDTHVVLRIKWVHEMVCSAQSKAPMYEAMLLASFTNGYLGIVAAEKGSPTGEVMLRHLRALLQDVDVYGWRVVREYHAAWLQLLE